MKKKIFSILNNHGITLSSAISLNDCHIIRKYKLEKAGFSENDELFAVIFAVPYLTHQEGRNLSAYATPRDYHLFFKQLFGAVIPKLESTFPKHRFVGFSDDSPINERDAAARAGLGIIGENGLLITDKYSSYVFIGEIITDLPIECEALEIVRCRNCGACRNACPVKFSGECLSAVTQKKGSLTEDEIKAIKNNGAVWGCDRCQEVCPHTTKAVKNGTIYTDIEFFKKDNLSHLNSSILENMTDEEFASRAYSWRGKGVIKRNLEIFEKN